MSISWDGGGVMDDEISGGWPPPEPYYTLSQGVKEIFRYLTSRSRRLTIRYYEEILFYALNNDESLSGVMKKWELRKYWKGMGKYPDYWAIEMIFEVPFQDLPLHISYPLDDKDQDSLDPLKGLVAKWRLKNGI
jgi:hypothetical protein